MFHHVSWFWGPRVWYIFTYICLIFDRKFVGKYTTMVPWMLKILATILDTYRPLSPFPPIHPPVFEKIHHFSPGPPINGLGKFRKSLSILAWNPKQPDFYGCFNWMIPNLFLGNGYFTKHPFKTGCLGFQVEIDHSPTPSMGMVCI